jgi:predicted ATP-dependent endonuclease of OLD family
MHQISEIEIINFKSCKKTNLLLEKVTPLVGYNNAGKSNILKAIDALVKGKGLNESNFNDPSQPIKIEALLSGVTDEVLKHLSGPQKTSLEQFIENDCICIRFYQEKPGTTKNSVVLGIKAPSNQNDEWENPNGIPQAISTLFPEPTFINSMEDSAEDVSKVKASNTIGKLITNLQKEILKTKGEEISNSLSAIGKQLNVDGENRLQEFSDFDDSINSKVSDFFPGLSLNIHIPTPNISDIFKKGTIKVQEQGAGGHREFSEMGHGAQRAIQMTLIRHLAEVTKKASKEGKTNLLLIDEPELFLHPQAIEQIRSSLKILAQKGYQVVFATHSPFMIEHDDIPITNIVRKQEDGTKVETRLKEAISKVLQDNESQARLLFDTYNLGQILFSDTVLVAEGDTEKHVFPSLFQAVTKKSMGEAKLALVIATGSSNIPGMLEILNEMNIPAKALVDLDFAFTVAQSNGFLEKEYQPCEACLKIIKELQAIHNFKLNGKLPQKGNGYKASDIYELLANDEQSKVHINELHNDLKISSVWLWTSGAIEPHLCLETKKTGEWFKFKQKLSTEAVENIINDFEHIYQMVEWCQSYRDRDGHR